MNILRLHIWLLINLAFVVLTYVYWETLPLYLFFYLIIRLSDRLVTSYEEKKKRHHEMFVKPQPKSVLAFALLIPLVFILAAYCGWTDNVDSTDESWWWNHVGKVILTLAFLGIVIFGYANKCREFTKKHHNQRVDLTR